jgi:hypothetical protein
MNPARGSNLRLSAYRPHVSRGPSTSGHRAGHHDPRLVGTRYGRRLCIEALHLSHRPTVETITTPADARPRRPPQALGSVNAVRVLPHRVHPWNISMGISEFSRTRIAADQRRCGYVATSTLGRGMAMNCRTDRHSAPCPWPGCGCSRRSCRRRGCPVWLGRRVPS